MLSVGFILVKKSTLIIIFARYRTFNTVFIYHVWEQSEPLSLSFEDRTEAPKDFREIMSP